MDLSGRKESKETLFTFISAGDNPSEGVCPPEKKSPKVCGTNYPLSIAFIVVNEFCERFSYYGMKAVLTLYFLYFLHWDENTSTSVYHAFSSLCYFTPVIGALMADSWLGKYKTIIYLSIVYVIGHVIKSVGAIPSVGNQIVHVVLSMTGLTLIALGTGGIKPCVAAFGGDQFEEEHVRVLFLLSMWFLNAFLKIALSRDGSLGVLFLLLLGDVECFGGDCYALAFGVPAALMVIALIVFIAGNGMYKKTPPEGNILLEICKCIGFAVTNRIKNRSRHIPKREHWLDWASEKYSNQLITEVKMVTRVLFLFIPLPMLANQELLCSLFVISRYNNVKCRVGAEEFILNLGLLDFGAAYTVVITNTSTKSLQAWKTEDISANNVHISWQIPQYLLISAGEVMFSITGIAFSYSQAPASMKSVLQAGWLLTVAFGNAIVLVVAQAAPMEQWLEFVLFAALLFIVFIIFSIMGYFYTSMDPEELLAREDQQGMSNSKNMIGLVTKKAEL
uniref:solute carrier family 15 member 2 n=1 Tax=Podarcis muralis TaxID=64176 RepID=UPI0010A03CC2|nr:solute carrier family 15 member 2 [Podarcis muralis]